MANAPGLRFTDGTTTVTVSDGTTGWLVKYEAKNKRASDPEVTEQAKTLLIGGISVVRTTVESLNKLFQQARVYWEERRGACVYVERLTEASGAWYRSELVDALPVPEPSAMDWGIVQGKIEISLIFTRKNWWEGAEAQLPLTNANGTNNTSGLTVYNHDDAGSGHDNWVSIAAADVAGDLPAPTRLEITNTKSGSHIRNIWIGLNYTNPTTFTPMLEGEAATGGTQKPTVADPTLYSGGYYAEYTPSTPNVEVEALVWSPSAAWYEAASGGYFLPVLMLVDGAATKYRLRLKSGSDVIWDGGRMSTVVSVAGKIQLLPIRLPPWAISAASLLNPSLVLTVEVGSGGFVGVDYIHMTPIDQWIVVKMQNSWLVNTYRLVIDGISDQVYADNGSVNRNMMLSKAGAPILLKPGVAQRLYFLREETTYGGGSYFLDDTCSIKLYYRPRKLTLN